MTEQRHAALAIHPLDETLDPGHGDPSYPDLVRRRQVLRRARLAALVVVLLLGLGAGRTVLQRQANAQALQDGVKQAGVMRVLTTQPRAGDSQQTVLLPGTLQAAVQAPIAARASGYLRRWTKDIGASVSKGELLAEIDTPEIAQQLGQAVAARDQVAANLALAQSTQQRWEAMRQKDVVSQQELDERRSAAVQARANLDAADANVQRLRQTEGFKRVLAPFAGVITRRNVEVGDLIDAGAGRPLFVLSQTDALRVTVNVPQSAAAAVKPGQAVSISQAELVGRRFAGKVSRTAGLIDPATRAMAVEVALPNSDGALLPGAYVQVRLDLPASAGRALLVPTNVLIFRAEGARVAVVDGNGRVSLRPVALGRNLGEAVQVTEGVALTDRLVLNPSDALAEGDTVVATAAPPAAAKGAGTGKPAGEGGGASGPVGTAAAGAGGVGSAGANAGAKASGNAGANPGAKASGNAATANAGKPAAAPGAAAASAANR